MASANAPLGGQFAPLLGEPLFELLLLARDWLFQLRRAVVVGYGGQELPLCSACSVPPHDKLAPVMAPVCLNVAGIQGGQREPQKSAA